MTESNILDLEDLARRYDPQILREYLHTMDQEGSGGLGLELSIRSATAGTTGEAPESDSQDPAHPPWPAVHDMRPRCARWLRLVLVANFLAYWSAVAYCGHAFHVRVKEL